MTGRDPFELLVGSGRRERWWLIGAIAAATALHAGTVLVVPAPREHRPPAPPRMTEVIEIDTRPPPPPPPPEPVAPPTSPPARAAPRPAPRAAAPPAPAAQVITRRDTPDDSPLDLTDTIASGSAATYRGGTTAATGAVAPRTAPPSTAAPGNAARGPAPASEPGPDRSRTASAGSGEWRCPFPSEAEVDQVDRAVVTLRVELDPDARVLGVTVLGDPGHGFAREADRCARSRPWTAARDRAGQPIRSSAVVNGHFDR